MTNTADFFVIFLSKCIMLSRGPILWQKMVRFQTAHKSNGSFTWLGKNINTSINKTLNYMSPDWLTSVSLHQTVPVDLSNQKLSIKISYSHNGSGTGTTWNMFEYETFEKWQLLN